MAGRASRSAAPIDRETRRLKTAEGSAAGGSGGKPRPCRGIGIGGSSLPTYVMLSTLTPEGVQTVKNNPSRIREVNHEVEQLGAKVVAQWAVLGRFDFVNIVEVPDDATMARVSLELGSRGTARYESLVAIPVEDFIAQL